MKKILLSAFAIAVLFSSCSLSLESLKYVPENKSEGIVYSLPKNLIKVEITYTVREAFELINGKESKIPTPPVVTIDKPINVISTLVADPNNSFVLSGDRISNNFVLKSTLDFNLTKDGILKGIDTDIDDQSVEFGEQLIISSGNIAKTIISPQSQALTLLTNEINQISQQLLTANSDEQTMENLQQNLQRLILQISLLNYDTELAIKIRELNEEVFNNYNKDSITVILSKINHLENQLKAHQLNNKTFFKTTELKYTAVIDPFVKYNRDEIKTEEINNVFKHNIKAKSIFPNDVLEASIPIATISLQNKAVENIEFSEKIEGIVVRHPASTKIDLEVDGNLYSSEIVSLAQLGNISTIPVKSKRAGKVKTALTFNEATGAISQHRIEASSGSEKVGKSLEKSSKTLQETIDYLNYEKEIKRLETVKSQSTLNNEIYNLNNTELSRELANLTTQEQILVLTNKINQLNENQTDPKVFENQVKELTQLQQMLELEIAIKKLQQQLKELESN